ncbi:hypothetical protein SAY87_006969 [Trapa incisa]|uniref:LysM domain-containing protein n=1 Tax=Trapa incisa TaxID=236973 RepID=A0AAN7PZF8_9MYRT|nr:hypothetical protein SAY87_006969 [Trapa incisa]
MEIGRRSGIYHGNRGEFLFGQGCDDQSQMLGIRGNDGNALDDRGVGRFEWNGNNYGHRDYVGGGCADSSSTNVTDQNLVPAVASSGSYIEHPVSKFDTLAGVAIRYGADVVDIRRLNSLVTDTQMFALKSILIPSSGRHPPCSSNGFHNPRSLRLKSSQQKEKASPAMSSLQGYYGLSANDCVTQPHVTEMAGWEEGGPLYLENGLFPRTNLPLSRNRKSRSLIMDFINEKGDPTDQSTGAEESSGRWVENPIRRRQKSESNFTAMIPERVLKGDTHTTTGTSGVSSAMAAKGLALRPNKTNMSQMALGDVAQCTTSSSSLTNVRKSSSTPSLQDQDAASLPYIWPSSIAKPIFDGLPKPQANRRNKKALD